ETAAGGVSAQTAALVKGGLQTMAGSKWKTGIALLLLAGLAATGAVVLARSTAAAQKTPAAPAAAPVREAHPPRPAPQPDAGAKPRAEPEKPARRQQAQQMTLTGRVLTPDGKPAPRAHVAVVAASTRPLKEREEWTDREEILGITKADRQGRFRLPVRRTTAGAFSSLDLIAAAKGYGLAWQNLDPGTKQRDWVLRLRPEQI